MSQTVTLPLWLVVVLAALATLGLVDRLLLPSVRFFLRRRVNRAIERLNTRLRLRIQPFKLTKRRVLIDRLLFDPQVLAAVEQYAESEGAPREVAMAEARRYAREIVPAFSAYAYFNIGTRLARRVSRFLYRVRLGYMDEDAIEAIEPNATVVFIINHRSNMDYVLVTYMAASSSALSYAVGEWARVWLLQSLIRAMGAYFIRRNSNNPLYRKVLARYVHMATQGGVTQAVFPEGGLSRDGRLRPPKLGLLSYMVSGFDPQGPRDVVFIPVGLNYDRVLEDRVLTAAAETRGDKGERPRFRFSPRILAKFLLRNLWLAIRGRWYRYGYACVSFGAPLSLRAYLSARGIDLRTLAPEARAREITQLGERLMAEVGRVIPALPVSLVATAFLEAEGGPLSSLELKGRVFALIEKLRRRGAHIHIPRADLEYAVDVGLRMLTLRRLVVAEDGLLRMVPGERALVSYYANAIAHHFEACPVGEERDGERR